MKHRCPTCGLFSMTGQENEVRAEQLGSNLGQLVGWVLKTEKRVAHLEKKLAKVDGNLAQHQLYHPPATHSGPRT